ncbi:UNVERIFIED_CONTAM: hypothetical protein K2H54_000281 [Gekko kuhli]
MADGSDSANEDAAVLSRHDFVSTTQKLEDNITTQIHTALKPITDNLKTVTKTLADVSQAVEIALEGTIGAREDIHRLQSSEDWAKSKIMAIENKLKKQYVRFRGFQKNQKGNIDKVLLTWLHFIIKCTEISS